MTAETTMTALDLLKLAQEALASCLPADYSTGIYSQPFFDERLVEAVLAKIDARLVSSLPAIEQP